MITALLITMTVLAYFGIGVGTARATASAIYRRQWRWNLKNYSRSTAEKDALSETRVRVAVVALAWPIVLPGFVIWQLLLVGDRWVMKSVHDEHGRPRQLREDAKAWDAKSYDGTDSERQMARELARMCRAQADEAEATRDGRR